MYVGLGADAKARASIWDIIAGWSEAGQDVLRAKYIPRGIYVEKSDEGQIIYVQPEKSQEDIFTHARATGRLQTGAELGISPRVPASMSLLLAAGLIFAMLVIFRPKSQQPIVVQSKP